MAPLLFQTYNEEPKCSVAGYLTAYLKRTKNYEDTDKLFLACIKPYREASKDIISRWCKSIIKESGIKIHNYPSHSSRAVASFYAKSRGDCRVQVGNWRWYSNSFVTKKLRKNLSFKIICCRAIKFYRWFLNFYLYKKFL